MYINQYQLQKLKKKVTPNKVVVVYGARRTGKTTMLKKFLESKKEYKFVNGEDIYVQEYLSSQSINKLKDFIGQSKLLVIDEAQKIPNIGMNLKLCVDNIKDLKIIATGSSTFDLANQLGEPLTGRKIVMQLFPLSQIELSNIEDPVETKANLEKRMIYGSYPEVVLAKSNESRIEYLNELVNSYLYKDILAFEGVRKSKVLIKLLQLLAFQIGKEVSFSELASQLGIDRKTVEKYIDLLEKVFVIININGFSRNLRKEISKTSRYYFFDIGIRNALIKNFNSFDLRNDIGQIWENYLIAERLKKQHYMSIYSNNYFWRTYDMQEIDWIEEKEGSLFAYEFKWKKNKVKEPKTWKDAYPNSSFNLINQENYLDFIN